MVNKVQVEDCTYASVQYTDYFHNQKFRVRSRNVRRAMQMARLAVRNNVRGACEIICLSFYDEVIAKMPFSYRGNKLILRDARRDNLSSMTYYPSSRTKVLTRKQVGKIIPALAKRMREFKYPFGIQLSWDNIMVCKKYRVYKGYIAADATRLSYPPYPMP